MLGFVHALSYAQYIYIHCFDFELKVFHFDSFARILLTEVFKSLHIHIIHKYAFLKLEILVHVVV